MKTPAARATPLVIAALSALLALGYSPPADPAVTSDLTLGQGHGPRTVAFMLSGGIPSSQPGLLGFRRTVTYVNSRIQPEYGSFIAEVPGLYVFSFTAVSDGRSHVRIALRRNKETVVTAFAEQSGYQSASQTALLDLNADDIVYLLVEEGCIFESSSPDRSYTSFSGYLLAPSNGDWPHRGISPQPPEAAPPTRSRPPGLPGWFGESGGARPPAVPSWPGLRAEAAPPGLPPPRRVTPGVTLPQQGLAGPLPPADELPPAVLSNHVPRPPHSDVTDISDPPTNTMKFPGKDGCCSG